MTTIDGAGPTPPVDPPADPSVALRLVTTHDDVTRRVDIAIGGTESVAVEDGVATTFATERLWPVVRDLLPPIDHVRADPRSRPATLPDSPADTTPPGADLAAEARALVVLATVAEDAVSVRTWLATDDELWSVAPRPDGTNDVHRAPAGAVADLLVWDVTAALEALVHRLEERAS